MPQITRVMDGDTMIGLVGIDDLEEDVGRKRFEVFHETELFSVLVSNTPVDLQLKLWNNSSKQV